MRACNGFPLDIKVCIRLFIVGIKVMSFLATIHACMVNLMSRIRLQMVDMAPQSIQELLILILVLPLI